jgi:hypothetical protein
MIAAHNIKYDTDGRKIRLPKKILFEVEDDFDADEELADLISDETGFCVFSCEYREV